MLQSIRLDVLRVLRENAGISQERAAEFCGLTGRQGRLSFGAWERGESIPQAKRRGRFITYLWDFLALRKEHERFEEIWNILVEEWDWDPLSDREWQQLTSAPRPVPAKPSATSEPTQAQPSNQESKDAFPPPFQAPGLISYFVGRQQEVEYLSHNLRSRPAHAVYALVGMGGVGKTALVTYVAHTLRSHFADGILWGYEATGEPIDILNQWAQAYGCDFSGLSDIQNRAAAMRGLLADKHVLIVIDDVTSVDRVRLLLPGGERCAVLLTTRNEEVAVGIGATILKLNELRAGEGVEIFRQILGEQRIAGEIERVQVICERLNNLPLAVEIAAQFLKVRTRHSLNDLAERLEDAQQRLALTIADRGVRASFLVSWDSLDQAQRGLFSHMALFAGRPFTLEALAAVGNLNKWGAQDQLERLTALSLVKEEGKHYYRQHQLLADFAQEQLSSDAARYKQAKVQMAGYYLTFAQKHRHERAQLEPEWDNLLAAMQAAKEGESWQQVVDFADALTDAWLLFGEYKRAQQAFVWTLEAARQLNAQEVLTRYQLHQGYLYCEQNQTTNANDLLRESLAKAESLGDSALIAKAQYLLARLALERADYEETDEMLSNCGALYQQNNDQLGWARTEHLRAIMHYRISEYGRCEAILQMIMPIYEKFGDINGKATLLRLMTDIALDQHNNEEAAKRAELSLFFAEKNHIEVELGECYINKAVLARRASACHEAIEYAEKAAGLFTRTGKRSSLANAYIEKSRAYHQLGRIESAITLAEQCLALCEQASEQYNCVFSLCYLGTLNLEIRNYLLAEQYLMRALDIAQSIYHPETQDIEKQLNSIQSLVRR